MRITLWLIILIVFSGSVLGCTQTNVYRDRGIQLTRLPPRSSVADASRLMGTEPIRCEPAKAPPRVGLSYKDTAVVVLVAPDGPASLAGIRPGDTVKSVGGQPVFSGRQAMLAIKRYAREGEPLNIETNRGVFVVVPKVFQKEELCYWKLRDDQSAPAGDGSYVSQWVGPSSGDEAYARSFGGLPEGLLLSVCRVKDGLMGECWSKWGQ